MDRVTRYGHLIEEILQEYADLKPSYGQIERETIIDPAQGHYLAGVLRLAAGG